MICGRSVEGWPLRQIYLCDPLRHHSPASHEAVLDVFGSALSYSGSGAVFLPIHTPLMLHVVFKFVDTTGR